VSVRAVELGDGAVLRATVCVVGAGPAGLSLAGSLSGQGVDVLVLEAAEPGVPTDPLESVRSVGLPYAVADKRGRGLGGGSLTWNIRTPVGEPHLRLRELDEQDLAPRPGLREVGWPLAAAELEGAYRDAWALFGMPGFARGGAGRDPDVELDLAAAGGGAAVERRVFGLGPAETFTERALRDHPRVRVVTGAVVTDVRTDGAPGAVTALRCATSAGGRLTVDAEVYVLAGGGIENARLLLASRSRHPEGLGNAHDHVGRYFMEHPHYDSGLVRPADHRVEEDPALWDVHARHGMAVQRKYALTAATAEREGLLSTAFYLVPRRVRNAVLLTRDGAVDLPRTTALRLRRTALEHRQTPPPGAATALEAARSLPAATRWAAAQLRAARAARRGRWRTTAPRAMTLRAMAEQVPDPSSRVRLGRDLDAFGVPVAELDWRLSDVDLRSMARSGELVLPGVRAVFGGRADSLLDLDREPQPVVVGGSHQMGTTRMSASPRDGVVDPDGLVHGTANLYVAGSSVFPTGGSANPTLTIVALALRLGAHLGARLAAPVVVAPGAASTAGTP
jgi:choline dehydrogenase-like flavoprotein